MKQKKPKTPPAELDKNATEFAYDLTPSMLDGGVATWSHPDRMKAARVDLYPGSIPEDTTDD